MAHQTMVSAIAGNIDKQPLLLFKEEKLLKDSLGKQYSLVEENILRIRFIKTLETVISSIFLEKCF